MMKHTILQTIAILCTALCLVVCVNTTAAQETKPKKTQPAADTQKAPAKRNKPKAPAQGVQTLEDINIEGEIAVPQVLFITSRDYPRYRDDLGLKFRMNAMDVARAIEGPTRLRFVPQNRRK